VRCEPPFPRVGEVLEALAAGDPLMPVSTNDDAGTRSDGPPRAIGLGFQVTGDRLVGPRDMLADASFDEARRRARASADLLSSRGPFASSAASVAARV
jgi:fructose 1,6-bisphosphate aldolase/phosphatase